MHKNCRACLKYIVFVRACVLILAGLSVFGICRAARSSAVVPGPVPAGERLVRSEVGHFLSAGDQVVVWSRERSGVGAIRVFERRTKSWRCLAEAHFPVVLDLQVGPVLGDGRDQIVLALFQRAKLDVRNGNRLYVYSVDETNGLVPQWRGSGLSRPFSRFCLLRDGEHADIVALEKDRLPEDSAFDWISVYCWDGFGVRRLWDTPVRGRVQSFGAGLDSGGPFITFVQTVNGGNRILKLRPVKNAGGDIEFTTRIVRTKSSTRGEKAKSSHERQNS